MYIYIEQLPLYPYGCVGEPGLPTHGNSPLRLGITGPKGAIHLIAASRDNEPLERRYGEATSVGTKKGWSLVQFNVGKKTDGM